MKKLLLVALLFASPAYGQLIQRSTACAIPGNSSKLTCSLSKATTSGSTIRIIEIDRSGAGTRSVAGLTLAATASGGGGTVSVFTGASNGTTSFTVTLPSAYNALAWVQEDSYGSTLDSHVSASGAINAKPQNISAGNLTTSAAGDYLMVGCEDNLGSDSLIAGAGYNAFLTSALVPGGFEDKVAGAAGSYAANGQLSFAQYQWTCLGVAFKSGAPPPPPPPPPPQTCTATGTVTVNGQTVPPLTMLSAFTMPQATVGTAYSQSVGTAAQVSGGVTPYTYAIISGSLPAGLSMNSAGTVSGTPTTAGTSTFGVQVTDSSGTAIVFEMKLVAGQ